MILIMCLTDMLSPQADNSFAVELGTSLGVLTIGRFHNLTILFNRPLYTHTQRRTCHRSSCISYSLKFVCQNFTTQQ